jgi:hypothetical protein
LNDIMSNNELVGSNLYISPMNSTGIDDISNHRTNYLSKISSAFYPDIDLT